MIPDSIVAFPYGDHQIEFRLPPGVALPSKHIAPAVGMDRGLSSDPRKLTERALAEPVGSATLERLAAGKERVVVIVDDLTRPTPVREMLAPILERLAWARVPEAGIELLIALGTHRPMTPAEQLDRFGPDVMNRFRVTNHNAYDESQLVDLGSTPNGTPISVNRRIIEADMVIGLGSILPHRYCGWSGGAKIVQPGVCGEATTIATHLMITRAGVALGVVENPVRAEMEAVAERVGLAFIVNATVDRSSRPVHVVAGHPVKAHRMGIQRALPWSAVAYPRLAEVVIAGSHPADINLWQAGKGLYAADVVALDGATVFLVSPLLEGLGEHPEYMSLLNYDAPEIEARYRRGIEPDGLAVAAALAVKRLVERTRVVLVTDGLSLEERASVPLAVVTPTEFQAALDAALEGAGKGAGVALLPNAPEILPMVER